MLESYSFEAVHAFSTLHDVLKKMTEKLHE